MIERMRGFVDRMRGVPYDFGGSREPADTSAFRDRIFAQLNSSPPGSRFAAGGELPSSEDIEWSSSRPGRHSTIEGDTVVCECGQSFTHPSAAKRMDWFSFGHDHGFPHA